MILGNGQILISAYARLSVLALAAIALVFTIASTAFAEKEEIYFSADRQREITEENVTILQGNVEVHFRDYIIHAEEMRVDDDKQELYAVGNVKMEGEDRIIYGDALWHNYDTEQFLMVNVHGQILMEDVSEPVYFTAKEIRGTPKVFKMVDGTVTTCTPDEPNEVHIRAKMIKVMEDNKIIFRNGYFFVYDVPILYFPYWVFSLRDVPYEIRAGKNDTDGFYVEVDWHYLYERNILGTIIGNFYEKRGWEFGADHQWNIPSQGTGTFYFTYLRDRKAGPQTVIKLSQNFQPSKNSRIGINLDQSSRDFAGSKQSSNDRLNSRVSFTRTTPHATIGLNFTLNTMQTGAGKPDYNADLNELIKPGTESTDFQSDFNYRQDWKKAGMVLNTRISYSAMHQTGSAADQRLKSNYDLSSSTGKKIDWQVLFDFTADPDGDKKPSDTGNFLEKVPEITMTLKPELFNWIDRNPLGIQMKPIRLQGGRYFDLRPSGEIKGLFGSLDTEFTKDQKLGESANLRYSLGYNQAISDDGNAKYVYRPSINFDKKFSKKVNMTMTWNNADDKGRNPYPTFDRSGNQNSISWNLNYKEGKKWDMRWNTNYNIKSKTWGNLTWQIGWTPDDRWKTNMTLSYNIEQSNFGDLNPTITYSNNKNFKNDTQLNYSLKDGKLTRFRNFTNLFIGEEWIIEVTLEPNLNESFTSDLFRDVLITKYNPCTFFQFSYQVQRNQFFLTWGVTAFSTAKISVGQGLDSFGSFDQFSSSGSSFGSGGFSAGGYN